MGSTAFAFTPIPENDSTEFYFDFILNRKVYTKVAEMPHCKRDIFAFFSQINFNDFTTEDIKDTHGEVAFIIEPDGSIKHARIKNSIHKDIDKQVIYQIKRNSKSWTVGKHNGIAVPVEITYPYNLSIY
jgi:hypothetical protein